MKKNASFSIEEETLKDFKKACDATAVNQSAWIALKMIEYSKEVEDEKRNK